MGNSDIAVSVSIDFLSNSERDAPFHGIADEYSCADCDHLRNVPWEDIFNSDSAAASKFCVWVQVEVDVYIPHV